jgi:hypothetical protein
MTQLANLVKDNVALLCIALAVVLVAIIALLVYFILQFIKLKKKHEAFLTGKDGNNLEEVILRRFKEIDALKVQAKTNKDNIAAINEEMLKVYKKVGIVKYDAFNEMGGKLSFALAMLDKSNNGYLINAMHSREGCYTYIKEIVKGESYITLCDEERKALTEAINSDSSVIE